MIKICTTYTLDSGIRRGQKLLIKITAFFFLFLFISWLFNTPVQASAGLKLYYYSNNKTTNYTDKQVKVTCNNITTSKGDTPGILVSGVSMQPYDDIFKNSIIAADCTYDEKSGNITISKYGNKISIKIGSKTATVNNKKYTLTVAPMKVKYVSANKIKILVPSKFISTNLGLGYTWYKDKSIVAIVKSTILISINDGAKYEYSGAKVQTTLDGKAINSSTMPGIIINNTALLRARLVFEDSSIKAKYVFDSKTGKITLSKGKNTVVMTIGSKTAYLNNVKKTLTNAPVLVTNYQDGITYVMVPGSFTATSLGYQYKWNNAKITSELVSGKNQEEPELGDSGDVTDSGIILKQWAAKAGSYVMPSGIHSINSSSSKSGKLNNFYKDTNSGKPNNETFIFAASTAFSKISTSSSGKKLIINADKITCTNGSQNFKDSQSALISSIKTSKMSTGSSIELNLKQDYCQYDLKLSSNKQMLLVTIYTNSLISAYIGTNKEYEYLVVDGVNSLHAGVSDQNNTITITVPDCVISIDKFLGDITGSKYIKKVNATTVNGDSKITLTMQPGYEKNVVQEGKKLKLILCPSKLPSVPDKSKYEIVIPLPANVNASAITNEDFYYKNYFVIRMDGDQRSYYKSHSIKNSSKAVTSISYNTYTGGKTEIKINTSKIQGYELATDGQNLYVNVGNPNEIYKNIVVLDPGHGGAAAGATKGSNYEKNINFNILYTVGKKYFDKDPSKLKVYYTRTSDCDISLDDRAAFAAKVGADLFVSLHMNSAPNAPTAKGTEVYYSSNNNKPNKSGLTSKTLASAMVSNLSGALGTTNRGVREAAFVVTKKNTVPAILIELGFISNTTDLSMMNDAKKQACAAQTIYNTLVDIFKKYPG